MTLRKRLWFTVSKTRAMRSHGNSVQKQKLPRALVFVQFAV